MADRMLFISWGQAVRGMEERGLEVFTDALGLLGRMQQDGRIESFDVALFEPNGELNGYVAVHGSAAQIADLRQDEEFVRSTVDARLIVDRFRHIEGHTNEGVARQIEIYREAIANVPQRSGTGGPWARGGHVPAAAHFLCRIVRFGAKSGNYTPRPETPVSRADQPDRHDSRRAPPAHRCGRTPGRRGSEATRLADRRCVLAGRPRGSERARGARVDAPLASRAGPRRVAGVLVLDRALRTL
jgi:hypothetical protein